MECHGMSWNVMEHTYSKEEKETERDVDKLT